MSKITSIATAVPNHRHLQDSLLSFADSFYAANEDGSRKLRYINRQSGISTRYSVLPDYSLPVAERIFYTTECDEPLPNMERRMEVFENDAVILSVTAIKNCINGKIKANEITHLITVTSTGISAPGLDLEIMQLMQLPTTIYRTSVNFMGCYAALHALKIADTICQKSMAANVVIVCTELCSLHFQKENSADNILASILFGDGSAAILVQHQKSSLKGIHVVDFYSNVLFDGKKDMSLKLSQGIRLTLSARVPDLIRDNFEMLVTDALANANMQIDDITHWCIHPGGKKILEAIEKSISLPPDALAYSYQILQQYGNMSSPTLLFVLKEIFEEVETANVPATIFGAAFGPGLTMETFIATYV